MNNKRKQEKGGRVSGRLWVYDGMGKGGQGATVGTECAAIRSSAQHVNATKATSALAEAIVLWVLNDATTASPDNIVDLADPSRPTSPGTTKLHANISVRVTLDL